MLTHKIIQDRRTTEITDSHTGMILAELFTVRKLHEILKEDPCWRASLALSVNKQNKHVEF